MPFFDVFPWFCIVITITPIVSHSSQNVNSFLDNLAKCGII